MVLATFGVVFLVDYCGLLESQEVALTCVTNACPCKGHVVVSVTYGHYQVRDVFDICCSKKLPQKVLHWLRSSTPNNLGIIVARVVPASLSILKSSVHGVRPVQHNLIVHNQYPPLFIHLQ